MPGPARRPPPPPRRNNILGRGRPIPRRTRITNKPADILNAGIQVAATVDAPSPTVFVLVDTVAGTASYDAPNISSNELVTKVAGTTTVPTPVVVTHSESGWHLRDPETLEVYHFEIGPSDTDYQPLSKNISYQNMLPGKSLIYEIQKDATSLSWSGTLLSESQYTTLQTWFDKRLIVQITDDLGRTYDIYITEFTPKRVRKQSELWLHTYDMKALVV